MTRTCDLRFRKPPLYPAELRDHCLRARARNGLHSRARVGSEASAGFAATAITAYDKLARVERTVAPPRPPRDGATHAVTPLSTGPYLFPANNVPEDKIGELGHQRPQAGVFFKQRDHVGIQISVQAVIIAPRPRRRNSLYFARQPKGVPHH